MASSFGYGPVSKLLAVAKGLKALSYGLCFVGEGPALELANRFPFDKVYAGDETRHQRGIARELDRSDGIVNVMHPRFEQLARGTSLPHFYIDSLFWMWSRLNPWTAQADIYFIQNFPGVESNVDRWQADMRNPQIVGPIVDISHHLPAGRSETSKLVINYGGMASRRAAEAEDFNLLAPPRGEGED